MDLNTRSGRKSQGLRIQKAAEEAGLSLEELAREIGCSRALIYQYVSGGVLAQPGRLQKIARRTARPLTYFYEEDEETGVLTDDEASGSVQSGRSRPEFDTQLVADTRAPAAIESPSRIRSEASARDRTPSRPTPPTGVVEEPEGDLRPLIARVALPYLEELADSQEAMGDTQGLLASCERIVPFARELGDRESEARAWLRTGNARVQRGHHDLAVPAFRVALSLFETLGNRRLALSCRQGLGRACLTSGDVDGAMAEFRRVASGSDWTHRWQGLISMAAVHEHVGEFRQALECCENALEIIEAAESVSRAAIEASRSYVLSNQANVYLSCGDFNVAADISRSMMLAAERSNQRDQFIEALINLGICEYHLGEWDRAEENLFRAADLSRFAGDLPRSSLSRAWWANLAAAIGDLDAAKEHAKDALHLALETSSRRAEIQAQLALGEAYLRGGAYRESLYHFDQAVQAAASSSSLAHETSAVCSRARARVALVDADGARRDLTSALDQARLRGIQHVEACAELDIATLEESHGDRDTALAHAAAAVRTAERLGLVEAVAAGSALLARLLEVEDLDAALRWGNQAIDGIQSLRVRIRLRRGEEALLDDPGRLQYFQEQLSRIERSGGDTSELLERADWPPLTEWAVRNHFCNGHEEAR